MPRYARNDIKCVARKSIKSARKFYYYFPANKPLLRSVRSTLSLREAKRRGNLPEGTPHYKTHARYFCTCVEKKGANKQKSEHCRKRQCDFKSAVCAVSSPVNVTPVNALNRYALTANEERSKRLHLRKSNAADIANNRTQSVKCKALARMRGC